jgi:hypothetical protein
VESPDPGTTVRVVEVPALAAAVAAEPATVLPPGYGEGDDPHDEETGPGMTGLFDDSSAAVQEPFSEATPEPEPEPEPEETPFQAAEGQEDGPTVPATPETDDSSLLVIPQVGPPQGGGRKQKGGSRRGSPSFAGAQ